MESVEESDNDDVVPTNLETDSELEEDEVEFVTPSKQVKRKTQKVILQVC